MSTENRSRSQWLLLLWRAIVVIVIFSAGVGIMQSLAAMKKPPAEVVSSANVPIVEVVELAKAEHAVTLTGFGVVQAGRSAQVVPEVSGRILWRADLETGDPVAEGAPLVRIDARDHELALASTQAQTTMVEAEIRQWEAQLTSAKALIEQRRERAALSAGEADRLAKLWSTEKIGTQSAVDAAKRAALVDREAVTATQELIAVLPHRVAAAKANLQQLATQMDLTRLRIERCEVRSPFAGRVEQFAVELGSYAMSGAPLATVSDDGDRELPVALRADEVAGRLPFVEEGLATADGGWYAVPKPIAVEIWDPSSASKSAHWRGLLDRIARVDPASRMVEVIVRPEAGSGRPLPVGTFCEVRIPGKAVSSFRIPRAALRSGGKVFVAEGDHLAMRAVEILHVDGDWLLVDGELADGDRLILGRLIAPVSGMPIRLLAEQASGELEP